MHKYPRNDIETDTFILETAEPLQPVIGTLSPGQHGSGASTINGQDAYTGQLVPVNVWAGSAQQADIAAPLLNPAGGGAEEHRYRRSNMGNRGPINAFTRQLGTGGPDDNQAQAGWLIEQDIDDHTR